MILRRCCLMVPSQEMISNDSKTEMAGFGSGNETRPLVKSGSLAHVPGGRFRSKGRRTSLGLSLARPPSWRSTPSPLRGRGRVSASILANFINLDDQQDVLRRSGSSFFLMQAGSSRPSVAREKPGTNWVIRVSRKARVSTLLRGPARVTRGGAGSGFGRTTWRPELKPEAPRRAQRSLSAPPVSLGRRLHHNLLDCARLLRLSLSPCHRPSLRLLRRLLSGRSATGIGTTGTGEGSPHATGPCYGRRGLSFFDITRQHSVTTIRRQMGRAARGQDAGRALFSVVLRSASDAGEPLRPRAQVSLSSPQWQVRQALRPCLRAPGAAVLQGPDRPAR